MEIAFFSIFVFLEKDVSSESSMVPKWIVEVDALYFGIAWPGHLYIPIKNEAKWGCVEDFDEIIWSKYNFLLFLF